jgi:hypothetical protein
MNFIKPIVTFLKSGGIRISSLLIILPALFLFFELIPDLKFYSQMKSPPKFSIDEISKLNKETMPRYLEIVGGEPMVLYYLPERDPEDTTSQENLTYNADDYYQTYNYCESSSIKRGDTTLDYILYPLYSTKDMNDTNVTSEEMESYVVIRESEVTKAALADDSYFTDSTLSFIGKFDQSPIDSESYNILLDAGYAVNKDAIVLVKGTTPTSQGWTIFWTILSAISVFLGILSLVPDSILDKMGKKPELI